MDFIYERNLKVTKKNLQFQYFIYESHLCKFFKKKYPKIKNKTHQTNGIHIPKGDENEVNRQEINGTLRQDGPNYAEMNGIDDDKEYEIEQPKVWVGFSNWKFYLVYV